ncbi:MAG: hypothetical protein ACI9TH_002656 [Kiritimatiellia bacterium]|jgi:hypothetical protein
MRGGQCSGSSVFRVMFATKRCCEMRDGILAIAILLTTGSAWAADPLVERQRLDFFETKIRPVLVRHCYECHAADSRKLRGGLLLDSRQGLVKGGESGPAIAPGDLKKSLLISALKQDEFEMPPIGPLPAEVIADFEKWIQDGATDPRRATNHVAQPKVIDIEAGRKHWAYHPLNAPAIPEVHTSSWPNGDIDRFVIAKLEATGLSPGPDAEKIVIVRRLYFDLIGLPPTPEEIARFVDDTSPGAYENLVDHLMASPRFGERWGRHWLDVSRFAESMSLRGILLKHAWRYRDYVIEAFNDDRPYDQFLRQQLAGDLLEATSIDAQRQNLVATTFLMVGNTNLENQNKSQLEMDFVDEQLDVVGRGLLGQTITCARCHDHKFDPIPTQDYYAMAGILKNVQGLKHSNVSSCMEVPLPLSEEVKREQEIHKSSVAKLQTEIKMLKAKLDPPSNRTLKIIASSSLPGVVVDDDDVMVVGKWTHSVHSKHYIGKRYIHDANKGKGDKTLSFMPKLPSDGEYEVRFAYSDGGGRASNVPVTVFSAGAEKTINVDMRKEPPIEGRFVSLGTYRFDANEQSLVLISNEGTKGVVTADSVQFLPVNNDNKVASSPVVPPSKQLPAGERQALKKNIDKLSADLATLRKKNPGRAMVISAIERAKPTDLRVHIRGSIDNLGDIAPRGVLQVATYGPAPEMPTSSSGRLELANWIVDPANPLTSRVMANRVWHWLIGAGLVRTVDNFGTTGESPSHPELLDHLAVQFVQQGWSVKKLIREIVLSRTYRLSSARGEQREDPENRLLAHMNRRRLDAESIRDTMLSVGGALTLEMGGATFPASLANDFNFQFQEPRRSVYVPVFRNSLPELFELFDFANPNMVTGRRNVSTVAPQALFMMNHPFVRTQARLCAERLLSETQLEEANRIDHAYLLILGRNATSEEILICRAFLKTVRDTAEQGQGEVEAWTQLVQSLFSSIEFRYIR